MHNGVSAASRDVARRRRSPFLSIEGLRRPLPSPAPPGGAENTSDARTGVRALVGRPARTERRLTTPERHTARNRERSIASAHASEAQVAGMRSPLENSEIPADRKPPPPPECHGITASPCRNAPVIWRPGVGASRSPGAMASRRRDAGLSRHHRTAESRSSDAGVSRCRDVAIVRYLGWRGIGVLKYLDPSVRAYAPK